MNDKPPMDGETREYLHWYMKRLGLSLFFLIVAVALDMSDVLVVPAIFYFMAGAPAGIMAMEYIRRPPGNTSLVIKLPDEEPKQKPEGATITTKIGSQSLRREEKSA